MKKPEFIESPALRDLLQEVSQVAKIRSALFKLLSYDNPSYDHTRNLLHPDLSRETEEASRKRRAFMKELFDGRKGGR